VLLKIQRAGSGCRGGVWPRFTFHGYRFQVLRKDRNRITALRVTPLTRKVATAEAS
jgi:hypothetical protein